VDIPCSTLLKDAVEMSTALTSEPKDEPIGQAQQKLGPATFLICGLLLGGSTLVTTYLLCPRATTERDRAKCNNLTTGGWIVLGVLCSFPF
jgi:hypothetical protein